MPTSDSAFVPRIQRALVRNQWTLDSLAARMRRSGASKMSAARLNELIKGATPEPYEVAAFGRVAGDGPRRAVEAPPRRPAPAAVAPRKPATARQGSTKPTRPAPSSTASRPAQSTPAKKKPTPVAPPPEPLPTGPPHLQGLAQQTTLDEILVWAATQAGRNTAIKTIALPAPRLQAAKQSLGAGASSATHPLDVLARSSLGPQLWDELCGWLPARKDRAALPKWATVDISDPAELVRTVAAAARQGDHAAQSTLVALLAGLLESQPELRNGLEALIQRWLLEQSAGPVKSQTRLVAVVDAIDAARSGILVGPGHRDKSGSAKWRAATAAWAAPLGRNTQALPKLIAAAHEVGFTPAPLGPTGYPEAQSTLVDHAVGMVAALKADRRIVTDRVEVLHDPKRDLTVALVEDADLVLAWVTLAGTGTLVGFDAVGGTPIGLPEKGMAWAAVVALAWYADLSVSVGSKATAFYRPAGKGARIRSWTPTKKWDNQISRVLSGERKPPIEYYVRPHVRTYWDRFGSDEARARAPLGVQRLMGPHDTWVRGYWTGDTPTPGTIRSNLRKASALADLLASMGS